MSEPGSGAVAAERGVVAGNVYDKYGSRNPVARRMMSGFLRSFADLVRATGATRAHEVGCGEGHLAVHLSTLVETVRASDYSAAVIEEARRNATAAGARVDFRVADVHALGTADGAELIVCCEVLEHLERPEAALERLVRLASPWLLVSVPWEPLWRMLNIARGSYVRDWGNTPGHLNHWGRRAFLRLLRSHADVVAVRRPLPWTMALCKRRPAA